MVISGSDGAAPTTGSEAPVSSIQLTVNGVQYEVGPNDVSPAMSLVDYLRMELHLTGTKTFCHEGGCGVCTVVATAPDPEKPGSTKTFSVLGCRQLLYACNGWMIETVEGLGDWKRGYHPMQTTLAGFYGTQCGYCSPGMVMAMYGQLQSKGSVTSAEAERALDGNLCRCTGYRPILDAFKSQATDGNQKLKNRLADIEDSYKSCSLKAKGGCKGKCGSMCKKIQRSVHVRTDGVEWYQPTSLQELYDILNHLGAEDTYQLVVGNTAQGVYWMGTPSAYINTTNLSELYEVRQETEGLTLGANTSIGRAIEVFRSMAAGVIGFHHLEIVAEHWTYVANTSVRNIGSIGGNLIMKNLHPEFSSDLFLTLVGCSAQVMIATAADGALSTIPLEEFTNMDMNRKVIVSITLPAVSTNVQLRSYKITPRAVNAHAYVNSVVRLEVDSSNNYTITSRPVILYGGINPQFLHASGTEDYLTGHSLTETDLVVKACEVLASEVVPDALPQDSAPEYRLALTQGLLYKAVLSIQSALGINVPSELASGGSMIERPVSTGQQSFTTDEDRWPVGEPIPKVESLPQVAGEANYMNDIPALHGELTGVFIQSTQGRATIKSIDTTQTLAVPGVVAVVTAKDIPGENNSMALANPTAEEVFASSEVIYTGQALGLVVATNFEAAYQGAQKVVVQYENIQTPILTVKDAIAEGTTSLLGDEIVMGNVQDAFANSEHVLSGDLEHGFQHHFPLESLGARVTPTDDGYDVIATSIWPTETQAIVAQVLGIDASSINVEVRRIGGSFGGKINRCHPIVAAAAVAAWQSHHPVRVVLSLSSFMTISGGRGASYSKYKVGFDNTGKINGIEVDLYSNDGCLDTDHVSDLAMTVLHNTYYCPNWLMRPWGAITNTPSNTFMRAPGIANGIATMETVMEHIAKYLGADPLAVREVNLAASGAPRPYKEPFGRNVFAEDILPLLKETAGWDQRQAEVAAFNSSNRWRKRGIALMPMCFHIPNGWFHYGVMVNLYIHDGTVAIAHGGIEMGQGINTKVSQIASSILGVPLEKVKIKATSTTTNANSTHHGSSVCSDIVCNGVKMACENIIGRIADFKAKYEKEGGKETSWPELLKLCQDNDIDVSERVWTREADLTKDYDVYGGAVTEVEIDMLTGQTQIRRVDLIEDCGQSLSPFIDIGQAEGALIMGLGMMLTETVKFNSTTGQKLTAGTWEYKPLTALDIPVDLRVTLLPNSYNDTGVLRSKAVGEPPLVLAHSAVMALRMAITAARAHSSNTDWFNLDTPVTVENVQRLCLVDATQFATV